MIKWAETILVLAGRVRNIKSAAGRISKFMIKKIIKLSISVLIVFAVFGFQKEALASFSFQPQVKVFNSKAQTEKEFLAYDESFRGGVNIAVCDIDGDGASEIITGAGRGGGPHVRVFEMNGHDTGLGFFPFHPDFRGGIDVACGDVDGSGKSEVIISQKSQGQAWVKVYKVNSEREIIANFLAYNENFKGGVHIASGDINGDGIDEIITGAGLGGGPHVRGFNGNGDPIAVNLFPYPKDYKGGVDVALGDVNGDKKDEIIMAANKYATARVKVYIPDANRTILGNFLAFPESFKGGANISAGDTNGNGKAEIVAAANSSGGPHVRTFNYIGTPEALNFMAYPEDFRGGVTVAVDNIGNKVVTGPLRKDEEKKIIGYSVHGRAIEAYYFGEGQKKTLFVGGTHAGSEGNAVELMNKWVDYLKIHPEAIPSDSKVIVIPNHNPDAYASRSRYNAHGVDLNRNFGTLNWNPVAYLWSKTVNAGPEPFSEPENKTIRDFVQNNNINKLISYHSNVACVFVSELADGSLHGPSLDFARFYNRYAGYGDKYKWDYYPVTGDLSSWTAQIFNIPSITVELSSGIDWDRNLKAMIEVVKY